jgi:ParB-like chromosome segregation protein Spo0J
MDHDTQTANTLDLPLERILVDPALQPRVGGLDMDHVAALAQNPDSWPPLIVVEHGGYQLVDGFHRFASAQNLSLDHVTVRIVETPADGDLRALAFALNAVHGRPLTLGDRRVEAERLLRNDATASNLDIARRTALSPTTVATIREQLEAAEAIPATDQRVSRSGVSYTPPSPRQRGELPAEQEPLLERLLTAKDRRDQRRLARYFERLSVALDDGDGFENWQVAADAAEACRAVLGDEDAAELGGQLGSAARNVLDVAEELGYEGAEA